MKILEISVRSDIGGGPKHLLDLCQQINTRFEIHIAAPNKGEHAQKFIQISNGFINLPFRRFSIIAFFRILKYCKHHRINIVHSHGRGAGIYSRLLKLFRFKIIHTFHGIHKKNSCLERLKLAIDWVLKYFTDYFICVSEGEKLIAEKNGLINKNKTKVIFNGVEIQQIKTANKTQNTNIILGTLCRLDYQKGLDILIDYVSKFKKEYDYNFQVQIAGDGNLYSELSKKINVSKLNNTIKLIGTIKEPIPFLKNLTLYFSFSRGEALPLSVLEAMSCSLCCLLSNVVGHNDIIIHNKNGLLFSLEDYYSFKENLLILLENRSLRGKLGLNGKNTIKEKFTLTTMVKEITNIYSSIES